MFFFFMSWPLGCGLCLMSTWLIWGCYESLEVVSAFSITTFVAFPSHPKVPNYAIYAIKSVISSRQFYLKSVAPNDCFLLNICSEKQILPRIFYSLRTVKNPSDYRKYSFSHFTLQVRLFFIEERKPKIFGIKNVMERGIRKILSFVNLKPL